MPKEIQFADASSLSGVRVLADGYVHADVNVARTGIQLYNGSEIGRPDLGLVRVYRPESEVKDAESLVTFSHAPITIGHPKERVTKDNWKKLAVGEVSTQAVWKDGKINLPLILKDAAAIQLLANGTREVSAGYTSVLDWTPGVTPEGEKYDAKQTRIRVNHVAIVKRGRAGSECRIGDAWGIEPINTGEGNEMTTKVVAIGDDKTVTVAVDDAPLVEKLRDRVRAQDAELAVKDGQISDLTAKLSDAETKLNDSADLDARAQARADLIADAKRVLPDLETKGLSDAAIKKAVVEKRRGPQAIADKSPEYVNAAFDFIVDEMKSTPKNRAADPVRQVFGDNATGRPTTISDTQAAYEKALQEAWNPAPAQ